VPPGTSRLVQQLSLLAPQLVRPLPLAWQLSGDPEEPPELAPLDPPLDVPDDPPLLDPEDDPLLDDPEDELPLDVLDDDPLDDPPLDPDDEPELFPLPEPEPPPVASGLGTSADASTAPLPLIVQSLSSAGHPPSKMGKTNTAAGWARMQGVTTSTLRSDSCR